MAHTGHVYRVKANSQEQAIKRVERYLDAYVDSNIWYYIISVFNQKGEYTKIYQDETVNFPETSEGLDEMIINSLKPEPFYEEAFERVKCFPNTSTPLDLSFSKTWETYLWSMKLIKESGLNRSNCPEINSRCIDEQGLTDLTTRCKKDAETFFVVTYIHA